MKEPRTASFSGTLSTWQIFRAPLGLALGSAVGLTSALLGDGVWDALSWLALSLPLVAIVHRYRAGR
jgi:hypothetical protein